jgi:hypothetical protein
LGFGIWVSGVGICLSACSPSAPLLANTYPSAHAAATAVLDAFERRDLVTLRALALTEQEFREHIWPELPASRPERNLPFSYVWGDLHQKSEQALARTLAWHGGRRYTLVAVQFAGEVSRYPSYTVHRETVLDVRDGSGTPAQVRLFGSLIEHEHAWKVFSYVVDD